MLGVNDFFRKPLSLFVAGAIVFCTFAVPPAQAAPAQAERKGGLLVTTFTVPEGTLKVNLPDDSAAGDTISGTVLAEPAGNSPEERAANADRLNGYVVDLDKTTTPVARKVLTWGVPAAAAGGVAYLLLRNRNGEQVGNADVPVQAASGRVAPGTPNASDFAFPQAAVAGRPLVVKGPFTGDFKNSALTVAGRPAENLAQSPRKFIAQSPRDVTGPAAVSLNERGTIANADCRMLGVNMSANQTTLAAHQNTQVHIAVQGVGGLATPLPMHLVNLTPSTVDVQGGTDQAILIKPQDVRDGTYSTNKMMRTLRSGEFSLLVELDRAFAEGTVPGEGSPPNPRTTSRPVLAGNPTPTPKGCTWKAQGVETTVYTDNAKDVTKMLDDLRAAAAKFLKTVAPPAGKLAAALPKAFSISKAVNVYITYVCVDSTGVVIDTKVVQLEDKDAIYWWASDKNAFNGGDLRSERDKAIVRNTPH